MTYEREIEDANAALSAAVAEFEELKKKNTENITRYNELEANLAAAQQELAPERILQQQLAFEQVVARLERLRALVEQVEGRRDPVGDALVTLVAAAFRP